MTARAPLDLLLTTTADKLPTGSPNVRLTPGHLALITQLAIWEQHGTDIEASPEARADEAALREALDRIPIDGATRDEYAARLRLAARGVAL